uniref:Neprosin PEP catalytic domain-containing protein n=1 Tax=Kalanchoe fedtschenkoi TaxID=63787 RepID=A0A7N0TQL3_KALFE
MSSMFFILILCSCFLSFFTNGVEVKLAVKEKIELHRKFKLYNKPAIEEIKTFNGDTYKCVDFYKQPAFDHPLLRNHSYHPNLDQYKLQNVSQQSSWISELWANGKGCPDGTVPIRKYTRKEFIRVHKLFQKLYPSDAPVPGRFRATVHTKDGPHTFYGGSAALSVYNFAVGEGQYSASYLTLRAAQDQLQYGWWINPSMYGGDGTTRLFLSTEVEKTKCWNLMCGGYVHTHKSIPLDAPITRVTRRGSISPIEIVPKIVKSPSTKQWNLFITHDIPLGFWPNEVLKGLSGPAEYLEWGGEAYNPPDKGLSGPGMGSGYFPIGIGSHDGYARVMARYDEAGTYFNMGNGELETYSDNNDYYTVIDGGYSDEDFGHIAYWGGKGKQG